MQSYFRFVFFRIIAQATEVDRGRFLRIIANRYLLSAGAGVLLALPFNFSALAGLSWIAPGLLLLAARDPEGSRRFRLGFVGGVAYGMVSLYWLLLIPFPAGAIAAWAALSAYVSLFLTVWVWLAWRWSPGFEAQAERAAELGGSLSGGELWWRRGLWAGSCAALWVALEIVRGRLFSGFPWNDLGVSQYEILPLIQIASLTGVYGVSFLIVWLSVGLAAAALRLLEHPAHRWAWLADLVLPGIGLMAALVFGLMQLNQPRKVGHTLKVALIQPSIPQTLIWDPKEDTNRFNQLIELSERALASKPDLLVWPEAAVPNFVRYDTEFTLPAITNLVRKYHIWLILGADDAVPRKGSTKPDEYDSFNSSMLVDPHGSLVDIYRKQQLVIFGEYVPLARWLPFMRWLTPIGHGFASGDRPVPFRIPPLGIKTSVLICFEDVFPHLARHYVQDDTDFLLNLTNNGWFGESAAQWQQAASAVFRAVENGLPLVRCANNGLTCWIEANGCLHDVYFANTRDIYGAGFKIVEVPLLPPGFHRKPTLYNRVGDWFAWGCVALCLIRLGTGRFRQRLPTQELTSHS